MAQRQLRANIKRRGRVYLVDASGEVVAEIVATKPSALEFRCAAGYAVRWPKPPTLDLTVHFGEKPC